MLGLSEHTVLEAGGATSESTLIECCVLRLLDAWLDSGKPVSEQCTDCCVLESSWVICCHMLINSEVLVDVLTLH